MKRLLDQVPKLIDESLSIFKATLEPSANLLRWFFAAMFIIAAIWSPADETGARFIYPVIAVCWIICAAIFQLRAQTNLANNAKLGIVLDLTIISFGLLLAAWQQSLNTKGTILFICYFPVLALIARRTNTLVFLQASAAVFVFYLLLATFSLSALPVTRLFSIILMAVAGVIIAKQPKKELEDRTRKLVQQAYETGAADKQIELLGHLHAQNFPPVQYDLPGLYATYKHGVGKSTSGDFYNAIDTPEGPLVILGDMPGVGLAAVANATKLQRLITAKAQENSSLATIAQAVHEHLQAQQQTATCILARWEGNTLHYLNAGHLPAIRMSKRHPEMLPTNNQALGSSAFEGLVDTMEFLKGDLLLLYTDGVYTGLANNPTQGAAEILRMSDEFSSGEVNTICHRIFDCGQPEFVQAEDDATVVVVRRQE